MLNSHVKKYLVSVLCSFFVCTINAQTIDEVASEYMTTIYQDDDVKAFNFSIPANESLADHQTDSRLIFLLTELNIKRLDNDSITKVDKHNVFFLQNTFSKGFINLSDTALRYLVIQPKHKLIKAESISCAQGMKEAVISEFTTVCVSDIENTSSAIKADAIHLSAISEEFEINKKRHTVDVFVEQEKWITWIYYTSQMAQSK